VVFIAWFRFRQRGMKFEAVQLERPNSIELTFLALATIYSMTLPLKSTINLFDALVLVGLFVAYTIRIATAPAEEPHLVGPARYIGTFTTSGRRAAVAGLFLFAATVILLLAEHFAEALVATGLALGVSEFLLVQWLAPLASEAPELLVAGLYAWRLNTAAGLGTLVSSKVNQWTLLVGTLPIVFSLAFGGLHGLPVDAHQREELLLTASQSVFAVATLISLSISLPEALGLFGLFWAQFLLGAIVPHEWAGFERIAVSIGYLALAGWIIMRDRGRLPQLVRDGLRTPHSVLHADD
jgi:cation:H+ antiporter